MNKHLQVDWKIGVEIELLAPVGRSRHDLALSIAKHYYAKVRRIFYVQGEPSKVPGTPFFDSLTLGFTVEDADGKLIAQCVDDLTIQNDLNQRVQSQPDWYRIVSDDSRLLRLTMLNANAEDSIHTVLLPIAKLFNTKLGQGGEGMFRVADETGKPIAIAAALPGERERPCELITAAIEHNHYKHLNQLLTLAKALDFIAPQEGATHIHFDAASLCHTVTFVNLINILTKHGKAIKTYMGTNSNCRRLGEWPPSLFELIESPGFTELPWETARKKLTTLKLSKYCDFNIRNIVHNARDKHTFEVRVLPVWLDAEKIIEAAQFFVHILQWSKSNYLKPVPVDFTAFKNSLKNK